ncbi:hypothetical protein FB45DRAFT_1094232 [Roridomyces roridus]|uniref:Uncharacterized protein n=1 Tax=Roridomyces roridus TaxID=1738132 RepID=A0AAD7BG81_9AGAR|nr:hypothetical protein FB45DRAFT_1094232 [Roridomyces roridus]
MPPKRAQETTPDPDAGPPPAKRARGRPRKNPARRVTSIPTAAPSKGKTKDKKSKKTKKKSTSDDEDDADGSERGNGKKSKAEYLAELEQMHACTKHSGKICLVAKNLNGAHVNLCVQDLSLWAQLLGSGLHKSLTMPPEILRLDMEYGSHDAAPRTHHAPPPPPPHQHGPYPYPYPYPPPPTYYAPPPPPTSMAEHPAVQDDLPTRYPRVDDWLRGLDRGERGEDGHDFASYGDDFIQNKYIRLFQLADEGDGAVALIREMCMGIPLGTAKLIM